MKETVKKLKNKLSNRHLDYRVRLFHILALGGIAISFFTIIVSLISKMWGTAVIAGLLLAFSFGLILYTWKTGKYRIAYVLTVTIIFMLFLPMMFFTSGGHQSGMPSIFLLAVMFTVLMIEGKKAILFSILEILEYACVCVVAYRNPQFVRHFETQKQILTDIIFAFACVSIVCGIVLYFHLQEYDRQRAQLHEQNEKLKRYDESRSVFLTTVSHEVKNPLNAINLYARDTIELAAEKPLDIALITSNQQVIEKMVTRIDRILTDLKDTVAIEQGRLSLNLAPMMLDKLLREVAQMYFNQSNLSGNTIVLDLDEAVTPISADQARITQVVINILSNAVRHTQNGRIQISLSEHDNEQVVAVTDNGEGMKEEIQEQVFKGYISSDKEYWRHGIGLYVAHQIIEAHGGRIWIDSKLGVGTTVTFTLPGGGKVQ